MFVRLIDATKPPVLVEPDVFTAFHVEAHGLDEAAVARAIGAAALGVVVDGHAFLAPSAVRSLAGTGADAGWEDGFAKMVAFATTKGWTDAEGRIRAHLEFAPMAE